MDEKNLDLNPSPEIQGDSSEAEQSCIAQMLKGFDLVIVDGSIAAMHLALEVFYQAILLDESRPEPYLGLGLCFLNLGDESRSLRYFDLCRAHGFGAGEYSSLTYEIDEQDGQTLSYDIDLDTVLGWRALCHLERHDLDAAAKELAGVSEHPASELRAGLAVLHGRIALSRGDLDKAQHQLGQALAWDPEAPDAHYLRGLLHEQRANWPAALVAYSRAIRLEQEALDFLMARARVHIAMGARSKAANDLDNVECLLSKLLPQPEKAALLAELRSRLINLPAKA